jgi:dihydrofolate reductase
MATSVCDHSPDLELDRHRATYDGGTMKTQYYVASTLDGFIADENGGIGWLDACGDPEGSDYETFIGAVGALAMGSATYRWVAAHLEREHASGREAAWPYQRPCWVFSSRDDLPAIEGADVRFVRGDVCRVHRDMAAAANGLNVWIVGGGDLVGQFHDAGLLDELIVHVAPATLGAGLPLLPRRLEPPSLRLTAVRRAGQFVELRYDVTGSADDAHA